MRPSMYAGLWCRYLDSQARAFLSSADVYHAAYLPTSTRDFEDTILFNVVVHLDVFPPYVFNGSREIKSCVIANHTLTVISNEFPRTHPIRFNHRHSVDKLVDRTPNAIDQSLDLTKFGPP